MPPKNEQTKTYKLADVIRENQERAHKIAIEADDGTVFHIDPPELWDDDIFTQTGGTPVDQAIAIMGEAEYARFRKAGGSAMLVDYVIKKHTGAITLGE
jgi:hypothetical protein